MSKIIKLEKDGCNPCKMVGNFLDDQGVDYEAVNVFNNPEVAGEYDISSVPVVILLDDKGNEVQRSIGFNDGELEEIVEKYNQ